MSRGCLRRKSGGKPPHSTMGSRDCGPANVDDVIDAPKKRGRDWDSRPRDQLEKISYWSGALPLKRAAEPSSSSMRRSWLYLLMRSVREPEPVLIWPAAVATARSAMKVSSDSPERWEMTDL